MNPQDAPHIHVIDDDPASGKGFEAARAFATPASEKSLGLWGMRQRAKLLGGKIRVHSTPGGGTSLVAQIPYTRGAHRDGLAHTAG